MKRYDDAPEEDYFPIMLSAQMFENVLDSQCETRWPEMYCQLGMDHYDGSIELYFGPDTPADFRLGPEDKEFLARFGVKGGWANFIDGTEQYLFGERSLVAHPRWNEERWRECYAEGNKTPPQRVRTCATCGHWIPTLEENGDCNLMVTKPGGVPRDFFCNQHEPKS